jgi:hypothetical protein
MKYIQWVYYRSLYNVESFIVNILSSMDNNLYDYFIHNILTINEFEFLNNINNALILK